LTHPARPLDLPPSPPLGLDPGHSWAATEIVWPGDPLLFYTDGLVENPKPVGPPQRWDHTGLLTWLDQHRQPLTDPGPFLDTLIHTATTGRDLRDDVAALLIAPAR
jgi:hypothetical protein